MLWLLCVVVCCCVLCVLCGVCVCVACVACVACVVCVVCLFCFGDDSHQRGARRSHHSETEETQRLRMEFVLYCPTWVLNFKSNELTSVGNNTVKCSMRIRRASRSAVIAGASLNTSPP